MQGSGTTESDSQLLLPAVLLMPSVPSLFPLPLPQIMPAYGAPTLLGGGVGFGGVGAFGSGAGLGTSKKTTVAAVSREGKGRREEEKS